MACCVAQRLTLPSRCALPAPVLPSLQSRSLGKIRKSALRWGGGAAHPDRRLGSRHEGVCVGEDLGGALSPGPHLQRLCPHPQGASELSHILWREMFGKSDSC